MGTRRQWDAKEFLPPVFWLSGHMHRKRPMEEQLAMQLHTVRPTWVPPYRKEDITRMVKSSELATEGLRLRDHATPDLRDSAGATADERSTYSFAEISCALTHLRAIREANHSRAEVALILEDDMIFPTREGAGSSSAASIISSIVKYANTRTPGWSIVQLHTNNQALAADMCMRQTKPLMKWSPHHWSTGAYLISRAGMRTVLKATGFGCHQLCGNASRPIRLPKNAAQADRSVYLSGRKDKTFSYTRPLFTTRPLNRSSIQTQAQWQRTAPDAGILFTEQYLASGSLMCEPLSWDRTRQAREGQRGQLVPLISQCNGAELQLVSPPVNVSGSDACSELCDELEWTRASSLEASVASCHRRPCRRCDGFDIRSREGGGSTCWLYQGCSGGMAVPARHLLCTAETCGHARRGQLSPLKLHCTSGKASSTREAPVSAVIVDSHWDAGLRAVLAHALASLAPIPVYWLHGQGALAGSVPLEGLRNGSVQLLRGYPHLSRAPQRSLSDGTSKPLREAEADRDSLRAIQRGAESDRFHACRLPVTRLTRTRARRLFSAWRLHPRFLEQMPSPHVLFFERDVAFCAGASRPLSWFVSQRYDMIGAPHDGRNGFCRALAQGREHERCCCSAGLSLVHTPRFAASLDAALRRKLPPAISWAQHSNDMFVLAHAAQNSSSFRLPLARDAVLFAIEGVWASGGRQADWPTPFGVHKPWQALTDERGFASDAPSNGHLQRLVQQCPEARRLCPHAAAECHAVANTPQSSSHLCAAAARFTQIACRGVIPLYAQRGSGT